MTAETGANGLPVEVHLVNPLGGLAEIIQVYDSLPDDARTVLVQLVRLIGNAAKEIA